MRLRPSGKYLESTSSSSPCGFRLELQDLPTFARSCRLRQWSLGTGHLGSPWLEVTDCPLPKHHGPYSRTQPTLKGCDQSQRTSYPTTLAGSEKWGYVRAP